MKLTFFLFTALIFFTARLQAQNKRVFAVYTRESKEISWNDFMDSLSNYNVVLFGELHNNALIHWLELRSVKALDTLKQGNLAVGMEMFEADEQPLIDEYFQRWINQESFESEARHWDNYDTDYKPILEYSRNQKLKFIASNIPRRYAALVARDGLDTLRYLPKEAKQWLPDLPVTYSDTIPGYAQMAGMGGMHGMEFLPQAQAVKDATMAQNIIRNLPKKGLFLHINGSYHCANWGGIYWYIKHQKPKTKVATVNVGTSNDLKLDPELAGSASFIIVVPEDFTTTY